MVYLPDYEPGRQWKRGYLIGLLPAQDLFIIKWKKKGFGRQLKGIWRVHPSYLFEGTNLLPVPKDPARMPQPPTNRSKEERMATKKAAPKATTTKKVPAKTKKAAATTNGAKATTGRTRGPDKLEGLSEARRRNIAKLIYRERSKKPATSWPDISTMVEDKYDWTLPGSMTGRRLLREYGPDDAEGAIIKQDRTATKAKATTKAKTKTKKAAPVEEPEEDEEDLDEEEYEDEEDMEEELDEDEEDEDEEDEDEDEEPEPEPVKAKKVKVTKGRGKKSNPS